MEMGRARVFKLATFTLLLWVKGCLQEDIHVQTLLASHWYRQSWLQQPQQRGIGLAGTRGHLCLQTVRGSEDLGAELSLSPE